MSQYDLVINGSPYSVAIVELTERQATVAVNGVTYQVEIAGRAASGSSPVTPPARGPVAAAAVAPAPISRQAPEASASGVVAAPMPGQILSVSVTVGDVVQAGDTVAVMEAMKMENEIKAPVAGTILEVKVSRGQDVGVGEVLLVIGGP